MKKTFRILFKELITGSVLVFYGDPINIFTKPSMLVSVDIKSIVCIPVEVTLFSICIPHEIVAIWFIIKLLYCSTPIDNVESCTPYFMYL